MPRAPVQVIFIARKGAPFDIERRHYITIDSHGAFRVAEQGVSVCGGLVLDQNVVTSDRSSWRLAAAAPAPEAVVGDLESAGASNSAVYRRL